MWWLIVPFYNKHFSDRLEYLCLLHGPAKCKLLLDLLSTICYLLYSLSNVIILTTLLSVLAVTWCYTVNRVAPDTPLLVSSPECAFFKSLVSWGSPGILSDSCPRRPQWLHLPCCRQILLVCGSYPRWSHWAKLHLVVGTPRWSPCQNQTCRCYEHSYLERKI